MLDEERVLVFVAHTGRGKSSGLEVADLGELGRPAAPFHLRDGRVTRLVVYTSHKRAFADLGVEGEAVSRENADRMRRSLEHFASTGEPDWSVLHEEIEVHDHDILDAGKYRGLEGFARWLEDFGRRATTTESRPSRRWAWRSRAVARA